MRRIHAMRRFVIAALVSVQAAAAAPLFTFHSQFWLNLHHFLYVLGRARNGVADAKREAVRRAPEDTEGMDSLDRGELLAWDAAITYYQQNLSRKDPVF